MFISRAGTPAFDLLAHLTRQYEWASNTFGPKDRTKGIIEHIRKELVEVAEAPTDLSEWVDIAILAFDGARNNGATPSQFCAALLAKQVKNEARAWPDWRISSTDTPMEHVK